AQSVRPAARFDSRSRQAADPPPGRGSDRLCETREVSRTHLRLAGIETGSVTLMPESKKKSASDAPAESRRTPRVRRKKAAEPEKGPKAAKAAKAKEAKAEVRSLEAGRVHVYSLDGDVVKSVDLPTVFQGEVRSDLIRRAVRPRKASRSWTASACTQTWSVRRTAATCARAAGRCEAGAIGSRGACSWS